MKNQSDPQAFLALLRTDFLVFLHQAFATVYPGKELMVNWHIEGIVHKLELSLRGQMPRLIINLPPRHLKSFIVSVALPAFILGLDPSAKIICVSYSEDLAKTLARDHKRIVESDWYRRVFSNVRLSKVTEGEIVTEEGGFRYATSVGGTLTGRGADFIIIDDPTKPEEAASDKARMAVNDWYRSTLLSRLDEKARSVLIIVMQRLHVNDLTGFAAESREFQKLAFPAIGTKDEVIELRNGERQLRGIEPSTPAFRRRFRLVGCRSPTHSSRWSSVKRSLAQDRRRIGSWLGTVIDQMPGIPLLQVALTQPAARRRPAPSAAHCSATCG